MIACPGGCGGELNWNEDTSRLECDTCSTFLCFDEEPDYLKAEEMCIVVHKIIEQL